MWSVSFSKEQRIVSLLSTAKNFRTVSRIVFSSEKKYRNSPHCGMHETLNPRMLLNIIDTR